MANKDYSKLSNEQLIDEYEAGSVAISKAISGVADGQLRTRIAPGKWSILEVLCHIANFEIINAERIRRVLSEHEPTLFNGEPDDFVRGTALRQTQFARGVNPHSGDPVSYSTNTAKHPRRSLAAPRRP